MEIIVVLDNIRSMHNIGSIFRSCDAMGNCSIFLCGICATPPSKEIHKTALGSTESVPWKYFKHTQDAVIELKKNNYKIITIEQTNESITLNKFKTKATKIALVFGNEVKGVNKKIIDLSEKCIEINQYGIKQSMNVSVAAGIVLWAIRNK
ncbi:MAG: RNA methyltransferase [Flavobacteriales bacterium]|nr:RNA methyltransferase [Flavobacteriales bacterium]|tara:strand:+ start:310 stop:762 length:453 start_codon:yes stop_codon:yes gene_type:complete